MFTLDEVEEIKNYYLMARARFLKYNVAPRHLDGYDRFVLYHIHPGSFLTEVIANSLTGAFAVADEFNAMHMRDHASFVYNVLSTALRSREGINDWCAHYPLSPTEDMLATLHKQKTLGLLNGD